MAERGCERFFTPCSALLSRSDTTQADFARFAGVSPRQGRQPGSQLHLRARIGRITMERLVALDRTDKGPRPSTRSRAGGDGIGVADPVPSTRSFAFLYHAYPTLSRRPSAVALPLNLRTTPTRVGCNL
jgi:hypothetical protein